MNFKISSLYLAIGSLLLCGQALYTLDIVVNSESDSGPGTLRQAIIDVNSGGTELHTITFAPNVTTIALLTPLPNIDNTVTIDGLPAGIDCTQLSPVDKPEEFSAAITVTIDGSQMTPDPFDPIAGLVVCADNTTIRGIRVANISSEFDSVFGISVSDGSNVHIECCEIHDIHGLVNTMLNTQNAVGIKGNSSPSDTIISQCYVHTIESSNIQAANISVATISTGSAIGVTEFKSITECRVEKIQTGSVIYTNNGGGNPSILIGSAEGISNTRIPSTPCRFFISKQCEGALDCQDPDCVLVENCLVNCCQSGSLSATVGAVINLLGSTGITITNPKVVITNSRVCNISSGDISLTNETFSVTSPEEIEGANKAVGIEIATFTACLSGNTIHSVQRGALTLGGINSNALLDGAYGMRVKSGEFSLAIENNTICDISTKAVVAQGVCAQITDSFSFNLEAECVGDFLDPTITITPICSGIFIIPFGQGLIFQDVILRNNTITNITLEKRAAQGIQSFISTGYAAGIFSATRVTVTAERNTVENIVGAQLIASPESTGIFGGNGCKGIVLLHINIDDESYSVIAQDNAIRHIHENSLQASLGTIGHYNILFIDDTTQALLPSAQTNGIFIKTNILLTVQGDSVPGTVTVKQNTIDYIIGATAQERTGTTAAGISVAPSISVNFIPGSDNQKDLQQACLTEQDSQNRSLIQSNSITNICAGTNNSAYGILLDGSTNFVRSLDRADTIIPLLSTITNNTISHITGLGVPQPFESPALPPGSAFSPFPGACTADNTVTLLPFPFEPASGIYTIFGNCSTIEENTITHVTAPGKNARGITTQASNDMGLFNNSISKISGYGIFVGGASASIDLIDGLFGTSSAEKFETFFASTRNQIYSNSTFDNAKQGIELGVINWDNYLLASLLTCNFDDDFDDDFLGTHQETPEDSITIFGNHGQPKPHLCDVRIHRNGSISAEFIFDSPDQPLTKCIIQFFASKTNSIPHGEQHISDFNDPACVFKTDINGHAKTTITFIPVAFANSNDIFSAHVTVAASGQSSTVPRNSKGDTSEFGVELDINVCPSVVTARPSTPNQKPGFASILGK